MTRESAVYCDWTTVQPAPESSSAIAHSLHDMVATRDKFAWTWRFLNFWTCRNGSFDALEGPCRIVYTQYCAGAKSLLIENRSSFY